MILLLLYGLLLYKVLIIIKLVYKIKLNIFIDTIGVIYYLTIYISLFYYYSKYFNIYDLKNSKSLYLWLAMILFICGVGLSLPLVITYNTIGEFYSTLLFILGCICLIITNFYISNISIDIFTMYENILSLAGSIAFMVGLYTTNKFYKKYIYILGWLLFVIGNIIAIYIYNH